MSTWPTQPDMTFLLNLFARLSLRIGASKSERLDRFVAAGMRYGMTQLRQFIPGLDAPPDPQAARFASRAAYTSLENRDAREALSQALHGLVYSPHHPGLWYVIASACFEFGAVEDAILCLRHTLWIHPGHPSATRDLEALTQYMQGESAAGQILQQEMTEFEEEVDCDDDFSDPES